MPRPDQILDALRAEGGNKTRAAAQLGISRQALHGAIARAGLGADVAAICGTPRGGRPRVAVPLKAVAAAAQGSTRAAAEEHGVAATTLRRRVMDLTYRSLRSRT